MPVTTQIKRTDTVAPMTSALCHPKFILTEAGLEAIHMENNEMRKEAKSVSKWAASVAMARLFAMIPPAINIWNNVQWARKFKKSPGQKNS